ncbi:TetR/AcrR family transcriptional regulator [Paenibacillus sp. CF384]|uniref:TetR/AcrR family transcriptional regulator n=1 Tax=Paenibacillus sp. CF384 TaxID=1884382 RepID=UPI00089A26DC|nr:TetR/AcrR family transcriptional regulator [Paenibacillus sp. CF384]SDX97606.1 transcriptional regulator, TetR family [Paenibacillus sp. CF384]
METAKRKEQLLQLAESLIRQKGYTAFSYDDLSKHLGISKASIHYHFVKKEDLGLAVLNQIYQRLVDFSALMRESVESVEEKFVQFCHLQSERLADNEICPISSLQADYELLPETMRQKMQELSQFELSLMQDLIHPDGAESRDAESGFCPIALAMLSAIKGSIQYRRVRGGHSLMDTWMGLSRMLVHP